ncbi:MAG: uracil-DNA glycosylase [Akkermansia sp.]|nr:uracil-DNA glycosylase [Akkermansia sp.]
MTTVELVLQYLHTLQEQGAERLAVDDAARTVLREWMLAARNGVRKPIVQPAAPAVPQPVPTGSAPQQQPSPADIETGTYLRSALEEDAPAAESDTETEEVPFFRPGGSNADEVWENMLRLLPVWRPLRELGTLRTAAVPGEGNRRASIMFVGDAPNYYDEREGRPFRGEAGEKLNGILKAMGLTREQVYLTHLVKFRPSLPRQTTNNRAPNDKEIRFSTSVVELEARLVQPKVIVALGIIAARGLLQRGELPLSAYRQERGLFCGIPVIVTHHPSYLLRTNDLAERRALWLEMLQAMELAGLPISDKQRAFFTKK